MTQILAADIGGTNARFAAFEHGPGGLVMGRSVWLDSAGASSFPDLLDRLRAAGSPIALEDADIVALAVAGPVRGGVRCDPPNLAWGVDISDPAALGLRRAVLLNDFAAQAHASLTGAMDGALAVLPGVPEPQGALAVVGPGTGLGLAALVPDGRGGHVVMPTEGGHALFPFAGDAEFAFQRFLMARTGRSQIIGDMVVSGPGLSAVHAFLCGEELPPAEVGARLGSSPRTLRWAARFLGRTCRNFALQTLALGGVVLCGGVAARNPSLVLCPAFAEEFRRSETHGALLSCLPVRLNVNQESGLWGAAGYGAGMLRP